MHIAFLTTEYVTESVFDGGLASYLYRTALSMSQRGHSIEIFTQSETNETLVHAGIRVHRIKPRTSWTRIVKRILGCSTQTSHALVMGIQFRNCLLKAHAQDRFDIAQAASHRATALGIAHRFPVPVVIRASSYEPMLYAAANAQGKALTRDQRIMIRLVKHTLLHSSGVYTPSRFLAEAITSDINLNVQTILPPFFIETPTLDTSIYQATLAQKSYIIFFGTLNRLKGGAVLAEAVPQILEKHKNLHFVLAGKTGKYDSTSTMLEHLLSKTNAVQERVINLGRLPHSQLYPVISNAFCAVFPSLVDNLPNALMEAMALGCPVVGSRGTSMDELIEDGVSGLLINPGSVDELIQAVDALVKMEKAQRNKLGEAAKWVVNTTLSPEASCSRLESFLSRFVTKV